MTEKQKSGVCECVCDGPCVTPLCYHALLCDPSPAVGLFVCAHPATAGSR